MDEKINTQITGKQILISLLTLSVVLGFLALIVWIIFQGFLALASNIAGANFGTVATLVTALISLFGTLTVAYFSYRATLRSKTADKEREIEQELRKQKAPTYEEFITFLFRLLNAEKVGKPVSEKEMIKFVNDFNQKIIVWGGDIVIKAWSNLKENSQISKEGQDYLTLFLTEDILFSIRADMGHSNRGLKRGDLLKLYIIDADKVLKDIQLDSAKQIIQSLEKKN